MKIKDVEDGWLFQWKSAIGQRGYGVTTSRRDGREEEFFNLSGEAAGCARQQHSDHDALPICKITDLTKHLPDLFEENP